MTATSDTPTRAAIWPSSVTSATLINTGGVLVASREVEEALFTHPAVSKVAVDNLPDDSDGSRPCGLRRYARRAATVEMNAADRARASARGGVQAAQAGVRG